MKRRLVDLHVTDHALLRYLERRHGLDVDQLRRHVAGLALTAAQLGAVAVRVEDVRLFLRESAAVDGRVTVNVATVGSAVPINPVGDDG